MKNGGYIFDYHGCDLFPEDWFDAIFVLRTSNTILFDRLEERGYSQKKIEKNLESEIFQSILDEAKESFTQIPIIELKSDTDDDVINNMTAIENWINSFIH